MTDDVKRFELTTSLTIMNGQPALLDQYVARLDEALTQVLAEYPAVTAYFAKGLPQTLEIEVGLRFEGANARYVEDTAN